MLAGPIDVLVAGEHSAGFLRVGYSSCCQNYEIRGQFRPIWTNDLLGGDKRPERRNSSESAFDPALLRNQDRQIPFGSVTFPIAAPVELRFESGSCAQRAPSNPIPNR